MKKKAILNKTVAGKLLLAGANLLEVKPNRKDCRFMVYYFAKDEKLELALQQISSVSLS